MDNPPRHPLADGVTRIVLPRGLARIRQAWQGEVPRWPIIRRLVGPKPLRPGGDRY